MSPIFTIHCIACKEPNSVDINELVQGISCSCKNCQATIELPNKKPNRIGTAFEGLTKLHQTWKERDNNINKKAMLS